MRNLVRATLMAGGALFFAWQTHLPAIWGVFAAAIILLLLALFLPRWYRPFDRAFGVIEHGILTLATWFILSLAFVFIFIPGRIALARRSRKIFCIHKTNTYWRRVSPAPSSFDRQY